MIVLLTLLWCVYVSDCFARRQPQQWTFRAGIGRQVRGCAEADLTLLGESLQLVWTPFLPWQTAFHFSADEPGAHRLRLAAAERRIAALRRQTRWLDLASAALFVWVMGVLTILVATDWLLPVLMPWAIVCLALCAATFVFFLGAYRRAHGAPPPFETWLTLALSPLSLIRAPLVVRFSAAADVHPIAAAAVLCSDDEFLRIARLWHFDHPELQDAVEEIAGGGGSWIGSPRGPHRGRPGSSATARAATTPIPQGRPHAATVSTSGCSRWHSRERHQL